MAKGEKVLRISAYSVHTDRSVGMQYGNQPSGIMSRAEFVPTALGTEINFVGAAKESTLVEYGLPWGATLARLGVGSLVLVALRVSR